MRLVSIPSQRFSALGFVIAAFFLTTLAMYADSPHIAPALLHAAAFGGGNPTNDAASSVLLRRLNDRYDLVIPKQGGLFVVEKDGKQGLVNAAEKELIAPRFESVTMPNDDWFRVFSFNHKVGFVTRAGEVAFPAKFEDAMPSRKGYETVQMNVHWGIIDHNGEFIITTIYDAPIIFIGDSPAVVERDGRFGYMSDRFQLMLPCNYQAAQPFSEGLAAVKIGGKWGAIDMQGNTVITPEYDELSDFRYGVARMRVGSKWGVVTKHGKVVAMPTYATMRPFVEGLAVVMNENNHLGYLNTEGKLAIPTIYTAANDLQEGIAIVSRDGKWGALNRGGETVVALEYTHLSNGGNGFLIAQRGLMTGRIATNGIINTPFDYTSIATSSPDGAAVVGRGGRFGYIDRDGKNLVPCTYQSAEPFQFGMAVVQRGGKYGVVNLEGKEIVPCNYTNISILDRHTALATNTHEKAVYDDGGKLISRFNTVERVNATNGGSAPIETANIARETLRPAINVDNLEERNSDGTTAIKFSPNRPMIKLETED